LRRARTASGLLAALALSACHGPALTGRRMDPPLVVPRPAPLLDGPLLVLDLEDRRPELERQDTVLSDTFLGGLGPDTAFWSFQGEDPGDLGAVRDPEGRARRLRVTGERAFSWHPYPPRGTSAALPGPGARGLADLLALVLRERGVAPLVRRGAGPDAAAATGTAWVLGGAVDHFASVFEEADPADRPRDDRRRFRITPRLALELWLDQDGHRVWSTTLALPPTAEFTSVLDHFGAHRGNQEDDAAWLDAADFPTTAFEDMTGGLLRELDELLLRALEDLETRVPPPAPPD